MRSRIVVDGRSIRRCRMSAGCSSSVLNRWVVSIAFVVLIIASRAAIAQPLGWTRVDFATGVATYRKGVEETYVTFANLATTRVVSITGNVTGTPNGTVSNLLLNEHWQKAAGQNTGTSKVFAVSNGTFFNTHTNPTLLSIGLKTSGRIVSYGSDLGKNLGWNRALSINNSTSIAGIQDHSKAVFDSSTPDVVGGLDMNSPNFTALAERTCLGLDGRFLFLYSTKKKVAPLAVISDLKAWGSRSMIMLDGGGSTCLIVKGSKKLSTTRAIPHAIAIYSGK